jgi:hypothetical protein
MRLSTALRGLTMEKGLLQRVQISRLPEPIDRLLSGALGTDIHAADVLIDTNALEAFFSANTT